MYQPRLPHERHPTPRNPARRRAILRATLVVAGTLLAVACTTSPSAAPSGGPAVTPTSATTTVRAYFFLGSFTGDAGLVPVEREVSRLEPAGATERQAIEALLAGPNDAELGARPAMFTVLPEGTRLLGYELDGDGVAALDLSGEFAGAGSASARGRLAQVVYTLTQFPSVQGVRFEVDGVPVTSFTDAGIDLSAPVDRSGFTDQLPVIFVDTPPWGGTLANSARLTGLANTFEATFFVGILDAGGHSLASAPATASCGTGCWGTFDVTLPYTTPDAAPGTLQVYEHSAADGSIINRTEYPVTLTP